MHLEDAHKNHIKFMWQIHKKIRKIHVADTYKNI